MKPANIIFDFSDFFLPRFCPSCGNRINSGELIVCPGCLNKICRAEKIRLESEFLRKFSAKEFISGFTSLFVFEKDKELQRIIHSIKYGGRFGTGIFLGKLIGDGLEETIKNWNIDYITPVPLHHLKKAERGYNQSFYIAKGLSKRMKIRLKRDALRRVRYTATQTTMNIDERQRNVEGAFKAKLGTQSKGKNFLIVDDVITTGATINECAKSLLAAGAGRIFAASAAIAD